MTASRIFVIAGFKEIMANATAGCYLQNVCLICIYRFSPLPSNTSRNLQSSGKVDPLLLPMSITIPGELLSNETRRVPNATFKAHDDTRRRSICVLFVCMKIRRRNIDRLNSTLLLSITL